MPSAEHHSELERLQGVWIGALDVQKRARAEEIAAFADCAHGRGTGPSDALLAATESASETVDAAHDALWAYWREQG